MLHLSLIEYSRHIETQKVLLFVLGIAVASSCLTPKEKLEIALDGKGTYFELTFRRAVFTRHGQTRVIPLLDYLSSVAFGRQVVVEKKKTDKSYGVTYEGRYYQITPIERRYTYSRANWLTTGTSVLYQVTDPKNQTTVLVAAVTATPNDVARQAHLSINSHRG